MSLREQLRDYQERVVAFAEKRILEPTDEPKRLLVSSPTGTGKSWMQLALREEFPGSVILSPSEEILRGYCRVLGVALREREEHGLYTPVAYRNRLMDGLEPAPLMIFDEAHGYTDVTSVVTADILAIAPLTPAVGFTATPYRGTPKGTAALKKLWGAPIHALTLKAAVEQGYWQMPEMSIVPLLDDDQLKIVNGEFQISSVTDGTRSRLESLVYTIDRERQGPTVVNLPSTEAVRMVELVMGDRCRTIVADTPPAERTEAYEFCRNDGVLLQIKAISVGVDMPWLQTMIDARPTMSPVLWLQTFGRLTRPYPVTKKYVCCNRNLERHAYLLEGLAPMSVIGESQEAFEGPSIRAATATMGLEAVGRFKPIPVPLENGVNAAMYVLQSLDIDRKLREYILLCLPNYQQPLVFSRLSGAAVQTEEGALPTRKWGKWSLLRSMPDDFVGYKTSPQRGELSEKQKAFWGRAAAHRGLDPAAADEMERRQFPILPALLDAKISLRSLLT